MMNCENCGCEVRISSLERLLEELPRDVSRIRRDLGRIEKMLVGLLVAGGLGAGGLTLSNCGALERAAVVAELPNGSAIAVSAEETDAGCVALEAELVDEDGNTIGAARCAAKKQE